MGFIGHTCGVKVQKVQRVVAASPQVKKGRGSAAGCVEGLHRFRSGGGDSACGAEGGGLPWAMLTKSALRIHLSVSYGMIGILLIGSPPPIRLRRTSPCSGGRIGFYAFLQRHGSMAKYP